MTHLNSLTRKTSLVSSFDHLSFLNFPHVPHPVPGQGESLSHESLKTLSHTLLCSWFPISTQLRNYSFSKGLSDLGAGLTIAFVLIPQSIAYSSLARLSPIHALTSAVFPVLTYALLGSSPHLAIGPEALSSVLVGVTIDQFLSSSNNLNDISPSSVAATLTLMVGLSSILLGSFQAGFIQNILSGYLLTGFVLGVAMLIMSEQLIELLGLDPRVVQLHGDFSTFEKLKTCISGFSTLSLATTIVGLSSFAFLVIIKGIKTFFKKKTSFQKVSLIPDILILVFMATLLSYTLDFKSRGIRTLGLFENKLVPPVLPQLNVNSISRLLGSTFLIIMVGFLESQTVTRTFGMKCGYFPSPDQELVALGMSNVVGAFVGGYVTFGSLPRSRIQFTAGGKTMMTGIFAALFVFLTFTFATGILQFLPRATLAAIVFNAAVNLIEYDEIWFVFKMRNWREIGMFLATWTTTTFLEMGLGIILSFLLSVLLIVKKSTFVDLVLVGELPPKELANLPAVVTESNCNGRMDDNAVEESSSKTSHSQFVNVAEHPQAILRDGMLMIMVRGPLYFYNAGRIRRDIDHLMQQDSHSPARDVGTENDVGADQSSLSQSETMPSSTALPDSTHLHHDPSTISQAMSTIIRKRRRQPSAGHRRGKLSFASASSIHVSSETLPQVEIREQPRIAVVVDPTRSTNSSSCTENATIQLPVFSDPDPTHTTFHGSSLPPDGRFVLILDFEQCTQMDSAAVLILVRIIKNFHHSKHPRGEIRVIFAGVHPVRHEPLFRKSGLIQILGKDGIFQTLAEAVHDVEMSRCGLKKKD